MEWFDAHCHCDSAADARDWVRLARAAGLLHAASCATGLSSIRQQLADLGDPFWLRCLGVYPLEAPRLTDADVEAAIRLLRANVNRFQALGEIGLDYSKSADPAGFSRQRAVFVRQLELGVELQKPVVVHSRGAEADCVAFIRQKPGLRALLHWFAGSEDVLGLAVDADCFFSVGPAVDRSKSLQAVVRAAWPDRLLLETDAPVSFSGQASDPSCIPRVGASVGRLLGVPVFDVARQTTANAKSFFGIAAAKPGGWGSASLD